MKHRLLSLCFLTGIAFLFLGSCASPKETTYTCGGFQCSYASDLYEVTGESTEESLRSFFLYRKEKPFNRIEFNVYRYEPEMVSTLLPDALEGELNIDVMEIANRATQDFDILEETGPVCPGYPRRTYEACDLRHIRDANGVEAYVMVNSAQIRHYNIITIAWGDSLDTIESYYDVFMSFQVKEN